VKIVVLADTHATHLGALPASLVGVLLKADMILHLGDYEHRELVDDLMNLNNFHGVAGNHDFDHIQDILPSQDIVEINGKRIGIIHGHGCSAPLGIQHGLRRRFRGENLDAILFGHTHRMKNTVDNGILYFNPGSACGRFPAYHGSYGILDIGDTIPPSLFPVQHVIPVNVSSVCVYIKNCFRTMIPPLKLKPDRL